MTNIGKAARLVVLTLTLAVTSGQASAEDSFFDSLARSTGLIATPPDPPDFVKATRPKETPASMPVFAAPDEPHSKVKSAAELKAMDADLERAGHAQDAIRPKTPPAVKKASAKHSAPN